MMTHRSLLAATLVAVVLAGLLGPTGCLASATNTGELPQCCAQKAAGSESPCCCSAAEDRQGSETPATPAPTDDRSPAGLATATAAPANSGTAPGAQEPLARTIADGPAAPVYVVNCTFRC